MKGAIFILPEPEHPLVCCESRRCAFGAASRKQQETIIPAYCSVHLTLSLKYTVFLIFINNPSLTPDQPRCPL